MLAVLFGLELLKLYLHMPAFTGYKSVPTLFTSLLMIQAWHIHPINPWNGVAWSISAEWFCYFLAPLFIAFWDKFKTLTLGLFLYFVPAVFLVLYAASIHTYELTTEGGVVRMVIEFLMGISAYGAYAELKKKNLNPHWVDAVAMGLGILLLTSHYTHAHPIGIIYLCGAFILTCSLSTGVLSRVMGSKPLHYLGEISYSMYLVHSVLWYNVFSHLIPILPHQTLAMELGSLSVLTGVTIACAALTYHFIETPSREWLKAALARNKKPSTVPAPVLALSPAKQISA
jgi:peptidoglycan/LPS O-acetylase OafA/YrhL